MVENEEITGTMKADGDHGDLVADFIGKEKSLIHETILSVKYRIHFIFTVHCKANYVVT